MKKITAFFIFLVSFSFCSSAQLQYSIASDAGLLRNFSKDQKFWAFGQTVKGIIHFKPTDAAYAWISYFTPGTFNNRYIATAPDPSTSPTSASYTVTGKWRFTQLSIGLKHFLKGSSDEEKSWSLYGIAGFGLLFTRAENTLVTDIDTSKYTLAIFPVIGNGNFRRLTLDIGAGIEIPLGAAVFLYTELKTWIPTSDYPSPFFHSDARIPLPVTIGTGLRFSIGSIY